MRKVGSTMAELVVMLGLIAIIIGIVLGGNFFSQVKKAEDARRKTDLLALKKALEQYHSDHTKYPSVAEMTYLAMSDTPLAGRLCGDNTPNNPLRPYLSNIPCHPKSPTEDYVYFVTDSQQVFVIYTSLNHGWLGADADPNIKDVGCSNGCSYYTNEASPGSSYSDNVYDYIVSTDGFSLPDCNPANYWACYLGIPNPCRVCPNGNCQADHTSEYFCNPEWCLLKCKN